MDIHSHPLSSCHPRDLWNHFFAISQIPRPSGNERAICQYICSLAGNLGYDYSMDSAGGEDYGNIVIRLPATGGSRDAPVTVIQSHLDIVALPLERKNEPLNLILDGPVLRASGSTLGADNGIAVAMALTLMTNPAIIHGPLELLFTIDEESTMAGARMLSGSFLNGRLLINIDTTPEGTLTISSAGIGISTYHLPIIREEAHEGCIPVQVALTGGRGGHSGLDMHAGRANAGQVLARILYELSESVSFQIFDISWGMVMNAIPAQAHASLLIHRNEMEKLRSELSLREQQIADEYSPHDGPLSLILTRLQDYSPLILSADSQSHVLAMLTGMHHGIFSMSQEFAETVETSSNLALVRTENEHVSVTMSYRSSKEPSIEAVMSRCQAVAHLAGAVRTSSEKHSGWSGDLDSPLLAICKDAYARVYHNEARLLATHGTIECGYFKEKYPDMDIISIGTAIEDFHVPTSPDFLPGRDSSSPGERYDTERMPQFWEYIQEILKFIAHSGSEYPHPDAIRRAD